MSLKAKDILRVDLSRLIRFWVRDRPDPTKNPGWVELGHFFAGFNYKLARIREIDGLKRELAIGTTYEATGSFRAAQNAVHDYQYYQSLLGGALSVAMLFGHTWEPTHGTLIVHDWAKNADGSYSDGRIALVADPDYDTQMAASGSISGYVPRYDRYLISNLTVSTEGQMNYNFTESLNPVSAILSQIK